MWISSARVLGGAETSTVELMRRLQAREHHVTVLCLPDSPVAHASSSAGFTVRTAALGGSFNSRAWDAIADAFVSDVPDVALVSTIDEWPGACLAPRPATALILVRHMAVPLADEMRSLAGRCADAIVAVSHTVRDSLSRDGVLSPDRVQVIYGPTRVVPRAAPASVMERAQARTALGLTAPGYWVGFCGGLTRQKGVHDVVAAVRHANATLGPTNLFICGRADSHDREQLAATGAPAIYLGEIAQIDVALTAADVVVMATHQKLSEALPSTLREAMACGTPVLGYATGGIAEVIGADGHAGRLAQPDDPVDLGRVLVELLRDPGAATQMASRALERMRTIFDSDRSVSEYEQLFSRIAARE